MAQRVLFFDQLDKSPDSGLAAINSYSNCIRRYFFFLSRPPTLALPHFHTPPQKRKPDRRLFQNRRYMHWSQSTGCTFKTAVDLKLHMDSSVHVYKISSVCEQILIIGLYSNHSFTIVAVPHFFNPISVYHKLPLISIYIIYSL